MKPNIKPDMEPNMNPFLRPLFEQWHSRCQKVLKQIYPGNRSLYALFKATEKGRHIRRLHRVLETTKENLAFLLANLEPEIEPHKEKLSHQLDELIELRQHFIESGPNSNIETEIEQWVSRCKNLLKQIYPAEQPLITVLTADSARYLYRALKNTKKELDFLITNLEPEIKGLETPWTIQIRLPRFLLQYISIFDSNELFDTNELFELSLLGTAFNLGLTRERVYWGGIIKPSKTWRDKEELVNRRSLLSVRLRTCWERTFPEEGPFPDDIPMDPLLALKQDIYTGEFSPTPPLVFEFTFPPYLQRLYTPLEQNAKRGIDFERLIVQSLIYHFIRKLRISGSDIGQRKFLEMVVEQGLLEPEAVEGFIFSSYARVPKIVRGWIEALVKREALYAWIEALVKKAGSKRWYKSVGSKRWYKTPSVIY